MQHLRTEIHLKQVQKLAMTQSLRQQLEILQMPSTELDGLIATELAENPLLEEKEDPVESLEEPVDEKKDADEVEEDPLDILREIDENIGTPSSTRFQEEEQWYPEAVSQETLAEYLLVQLDGLDVSEEVESAVVYLIYSLDRHGLLTLDFDELLIGWDGPEDVLREAMETLRQFDPPGVAQSSAREALLFQLEKKHGESAANRLEYRIIDRCFPKLAERRIRAIATELGVTPHEVEEAVAEIKQLNPWPGSEFSGGASSVVIPDVIIEQVEGKFLVFLNDNRFPSLSISSRNRRVLESPSTGKVEREYVRKKFRRASWFIKAIMQRQETVLRIAQFITQAQREFLIHGVGALVPLTLQQAAEALGYNQSTISRAINGKYVQSPQGIHEMRFYFSRGSADSSVTARSVKEEISRIIDMEDKSKPLTDEKIAGILNSRGTRIKRRTVANYRKQMNIPDARKRRRF